MKRFNSKEMAYNYIKRSIKVQWLAMDNQSFIVSNPKTIDKLVNNGEAIYIK